MPLFALGSFEYHPRLWPTIAAIAGVALVVALGYWQLGRAAEKQALQDRFAERSREPPLKLGAHEIRPQDVALRRVEARGTFEPAHMVYLDNRIYNGVPGYHVLVPLKISGSSRHVLVNRGWIAANRDRSTVPPVQSPQGEVAVRGIATVPTGRYLELSPEVVDGSVWQNLALARYREATGLDVHPVLVLQDAAPGDGMVRDWPAPDYGRNTHLAYAFQWFALAVAILVYYLVTNVRRKPAAG